MAVPVLLIVIEKGQFFIYEKEPDLDSGRISRALSDCGIKICGDGILVFSETLADDEKTGHKIALFSPEQYFLGWENFRGKKFISRNVWKLQEGFLNSGFPDEDENDFDDM